SQDALGRDATAPRDRARLCGETRVPPDGRALRRARRPDPEQHAGSPPRSPRRRGQDRDAHHAFRRGGDLPFLQDPRGDRASREDPRDRRGAVRLSARRAAARATRIRRAALAHPRPGDAGIRGPAEAGRPQSELNTTRRRHAMSTNRRKFLRDAATGAAAAGLAAMGAPALAQSRTKVRLGYLHTLAVDGQIWLGTQRGDFAKHGIEFDMVEFTTGLELFQAMIGGSIDMLATGAVLSNFPARGQGKVFLINDVEFATAQLWVREDQGIKSIADLKGKKISTTAGTTAHVFLDTALRANGVDPKDVEIVNQRMSEAVTSFISGAVPAVALWVPFNIAVREKVPNAKMLADASAYYPKAAIVGGWAVRDDYYTKNRAECANIIRGW